MSTKSKHKRYFKLRGADWNGVSGSESNMKVFSSTSDANTKIGFKSAYNTSSPNKTEALADSNTTLVVTYEFNNESDQAAFKAAVDGEWSGSSTPFTPADSDDKVFHFKTEWLHEDGSVSDTYTNDTFKWE